MRVAVLGVAASVSVPPATSTSSQNHVPPLTSHGFDPAPATFARSATPALKTVPTAPASNTAHTMNSFKSVFL